MTTQELQLPGYLTGTWDIDPGHSAVAFSVRHLGISNVRGRFNSFTGQIVTAENPLDSTVSVTIEAGSVSTDHEMRDGHLKGEEFLHVQEFPQLTYRSTGIRVESGEFLVDGELSLRGVTQPVTLKLEPNGFAEGYEGIKLAGYSASVEISRKAFGVHGGPAGAGIGDKIKIQIDIEAARQR
ncbi:YceI family protein (plasmid) [Streptomyces sp. NBC_00335]|uniref:YceI family protein n=1 Tax=unclassified Streptomyces TaxID=2593676 RepID=UPI002259CDD3|nr:MULTISPECIES: YceI family protein [unclassified Streptomyces]MCX5410001.1 YceI family protein [Streptomyces sp. NBC_00086]